MRFPNCPYHLNLDEVDVVVVTVLLYYVIELARINLVGNDEYGLGVLNPLGQLGVRSRGESGVRHVEVLDDGSYGIP